jgi:translation initiation factor 1
VHIRVQQRNGKKSLTTVQGLKKAYDYKKVLKALKKGESVAFEARALLPPHRRAPPKNGHLTPAKPNQTNNQTKTEFCCNGTVVDDPELGQVIQLQGDQRKNVVDFLTQEGLVKKDLIKVHGF